MKQKIPEKEVVKAIEEAFPDGNPDGVLLWRNNTGKMFPMYKGKTRKIDFGIPGLPDFIGLVSERICPGCGKPNQMNGTFIGIECKSSVGKAKPHQLAMHRKINDMNGVCFVIAPDKVDGILNMRKRILDMIIRYSYCEDCQYEIQRKIAEESA